MTYGDTTNSYFKDIVLTALPIKLTELLVSCGLANSKGEAKRLLAQDGIKVWFGGDQLLINELTAFTELPPQGLVISKSRKKHAWVQQYYGDPLWDERDASGKFLVDALIEQGVKLT